MSETPADHIRESVRLTRMQRTAPQIDFFNQPGNARAYVCLIRLPDGEVHSGEGTTQCEALIIASIHWALHGEEK